MALNPTVIAGSVTRRNGALCRKMTLLSAVEATSACLALHAAGRPRSIVLGAVSGDVANLACGYECETRIEAVSTAVRSGACRHYNLHTGSNLYLITNTTRTGLGLRWLGARSRNVTHLTAVAARSRFHTRVHVCLTNTLTNGSVVLGGSYVSNSARYFHLFVF